MLTNLLQEIYINIHLSKRIEVQESLCRNKFVRHSETTSFFLFFTVTCSSMHAGDHYLGTVLCASPSFKFALISCSPRSSNLTGKLHFLQPSLCCLKRVTQQVLSQSSWTKYPTDTPAISTTELTGKQNIFNLLQFLHPPNISQQIPWVIPYRT